MTRLPRTPARTTIARSATLIHRASLPERGTSRRHDQAMRRRVGPRRETDKPDRRGSSWMAMDTTRGQRGSLDVGKRYPRRPQQRVTRAA